MGVSVRNNSLPGMGSRNSPFWLPSCHPADAPLFPPLPFWPNDTPVLPMASLSYGLANGLLVSAPQKVCSLRHTG